MVYEKLETFMFVANSRSAAKDRGYLGILAQRGYVGHIIWNHVFFPFFMSVEH